MVTRRQALIYSLTALGAAINSRKLTAATNSSGIQVSGGPYPSVGPTYTYYVDSGNGSDANDGRSPSRPWRTLAKVSATPLQPGQTVGFRRGCVFYGTLTVPSSGTPDQPIMYGAYGLNAGILDTGGAQPQFNGSKQVPNWTGPGAGGHVWEAQWWDEPHGVLFINGSFGNEKASLDALSTQGDWMFSAANNRLYVYSQALPTVYAGWEYHGITIDGKSNIIIDCINVRQYLARGIRILNGGSGRQIQRCWVEYNGDVGVLHNCPGIVNDKFYFNTIRFNQEGGLHLEEAIGAATNIEVDTNSLYGNVNRISDQGDQFRAVSITSGLKVHHNYMNQPFPRPTQGNNEAIDLARSCNDAQVYQNTIVGILCCKNNSQRVKIYNNTIYNQPPEISGIYIHDGSTGVSIKNNIIWVNSSISGAAIYFEPGTDVGAESDYNVIYAPNAGGVVVNCSNMRWTFPEWTSQRKQDLHSQNRNPLVLNPPTADFNLQAGSPCGRAGVVIPGFAEAYGGAPPNIGSHQDGPPYPAR